MAKRCGLGCWVVCVAALAGLALAQEEAELPPGTRMVIVEEVPLTGREIRVGESDVFRLASTEKMLVRVEMGQEGREGAPPVVVTPRVGQAWTMRMQFVHDPEIGGRFVTAEEMRRQVESNTADYTDVATEKEAKCRTLKYGGRQGCYAVMTDRRLVDVAQPPPNDFRHVAVGIVRVSEESVLEFQIFTNDLASRDFFGPMEYAMGFVKPAPSTQPVPVPAK